MKDKLSHERAFTLLDLLAVLAVIAIVGSLLLPAMARTRIRSGSAGCLSNKRQVMVAWQAYAADNGDVMCPNAPDEFELNNRGWAEPFSDDENWSSATGNTNTTALTRGLLYPYLGNISAYKCPSDYLPSANGARLRSISMNGAMGAVYENLVNPIQNYNPPGLLLVKVSDLTRLTPANAIVFADESMATLKDAWLQVDSQGTLFFPDVPANYHDGAVSVGFADGHAEIHQWQTVPLLGVPYSPSYVYSSGFFPGVTKQNVDWIWWSQHVDYNP